MIMIIMMMMIITHRRCTWQITYLSSERRAPMTDVVPLGQTSTSSTSPRRLWVRLTDTWTYSNVWRL